MQVRIVCWLALAAAIHAAPGMLHVSMLSLVECSELHTHQSLSCSHVAGPIFARRTELLDPTSEVSGLPGVDRTNFDL